MTTRTPFEELPAAARRCLEEHTGPVLKVEPVSEGFNSEIATRVFTESGAFHVKGLRTSHRWVWTQQREAEVNPYLAGIAPTLFWRVQEGGWDLLVFEALDGHHADYGPSSADLPKVVDLLCQLGEAACPPVDLRQAEQRLEKYVAHPDDVRYFQGESLLHTDLNNANVLVGARAHLVDWAWATRGAAWLDAGYWVPWLMAAGRHDARSAERWAGKIPSFSHAPKEGVTAFAKATANVWEEIGSGHDPDPFIARMVVATRRWATYRGEC
ncbi:aminoglycoside phosphotransferase [Streptomyces scabiei]|uniref:aminoglycoside phosphotransferase n=1 Tax=Streptomyces scabiei TaxID=1930 RepID=UPI0033D8A5B1